MKKKCSRCKEEKDQLEFHKKNKAKDGLSYYCKDCQHDYVNSHYKKNRQYYIDKSKVWKSENKGAKYNLTISEYESIMQHNDGICIICQKRKSTDIDHDHSCCSGEKSCGKCIRGALCNRCNTALGLMGDSIETLTNAIKYLYTPINPLATNELKG